MFEGTITTCYNTGEVKAKASAKYSFDASAYLGGIAGMISYSGSTENATTWTTFLLGLDLEVETQLGVYGKK